MTEDRSRAIETMILSSVLRRPSSDSYFFFNMP
jgi:hypothetical protein